MSSWARDRARLQEAARNKATAKAEAHRRVGQIRWTSEAARTVFERRANVVKTDINKCGHIRRFEEFLSDALSIPRSEAEILTHGSMELLADFGYLLAECGSGKQSVRNYITAPRQIMQRYGIFSVNESLASWPGEQRAILHLAHKEAEKRANIISRQTFDRLTPRSKSIIGKMIIFAARRHSIENLLPDHFASLPNGEKWVNIQALKYQPDEHPRWIQFHCTCGNETGRTIEFCMECAPPHSPQDVDEAIRELRLFGCSGHSPKRTAIVILARVSTELLRRPFVRADWVKLFHHVGWSLPATTGDNAPAIWKRYADQEAMWDLDRLPPAWSALVALIWGQ